MKKLLHAFLVLTLLCGFSLSTTGCLKSLTGGGDDSSSSDSGETDSGPEPHYGYYVNAKINGKTVKKGKMDAMGDLMWEGVGTVPGNFSIEFTWDESKLGPKDKVKRIEIMANPVKDDGNPDLGKFAKLQKEDAYKIGESFMAADCDITLFFGGAERVDAIPAGKWILRINVSDEKDWDRINMPITVE